MINDVGTLKGSIVIGQGPRGDKGEKGDRGEPGIGIQGPKGDKGDRGEKGEATKIWFSDSDPVYGEEKPGDIHINRTNWNVYYRNEDEWEAVETLKGERGSLVHTGPGEPGEGIGNNQDLFINTSTGDIYNKRERVWILEGSLIGPQGPQGERGIDGPPGDNTAEITQARGSYNNLGARLDNFNASLEQKINKGEAFTRDKGININDFDEPTRRTFLESQGVDVNYVLGKGNVKPENTTFLSPSDAMDILVDKTTLNNTVWLGGTKYSGTSYTEYLSTNPFEVTPNTNYVISKNNEANMSATQTYLDINKNVISFNNNNASTFITPANCVYVILSVVKTRYSSILELTVQKGTMVLLVDNEPRFLGKPKDGSVSILSLDDSLKESVNNSKNALSQKPSTDKDIFVDKTPIFDKNISHVYGTADTNTSFVATNFIEIEPSTSYVVNRNDFLYSATGNLAFYNENKTYISGVQSIYETFTTPSNAKYVRFSVYYGKYTKDNFTFNNMTIQKGSKIKPISNNGTISNVNIYGSLYGKKWVGIGDSITEKNNRAILNYHDYVIQELGLNFVNMGRGGTGYKARESENIAIYQRIVTDLPTDADIITIFAGVNDCLFNTSEIGVYTDNTTETWCGCVNKAIDNIQNIYTFAPLGIITPLPCDWVNKNESSYTVQRPDILNSRMSLFVEELIKICKARGIPYLDLFHQSNLRPWDSEFKLEYYSCGDSPDGDGLHPNSNGHKLFYRKILEFIKTLSGN